MVKGMVIEVTFKCTFAEIATGNFKMAGVSTMYVSGMTA